MPRSELREQKLHYLIDELRDESAHRPGLLQATIWLGGTDALTPEDTISAFEDAARSLQSIRATPYPSQISKAVDLLVERFSAGHKLLVCGNGGSAADAMHICAELVGRFFKERRALPAIALNADPAILTAWSNDYAYELVFSRQVEALANAGDIVWGISTSGNSKNVVAALKLARELGASTIALTGKGGGALAEYADVLLAVPLSVTPRIQEVHIVTYHIICEAVEAALYEKAWAAPGAVTAPR